MFLSQYSSTIDALALQPIGGNSDKHDGSPSMDYFANFYFVSMREYKMTNASIYVAQVNPEQGVVSTRAFQSIAPYGNGNLNLDAEISHDGKTLYYVNSSFQKDLTLFKKMQVNREVECMREKMNNNSSNQRDWFYHRQSSVHHNNARKIAKRVWICKRSLLWDEHAVLIEIFPKFEFTKVIGSAILQFSIGMITFPHAMQFPFSITSYLM